MLRSLITLVISLLSFLIYFFFFFNDTATTEIYTLFLHDALPICVHNDAAGEVTCTPVREHAAAPEHVHERVVHGELPHDEEDQVRLEGDAVRERTRDKRGRDDREHHLVS